MSDINDLLAQLRLDYLKSFDEKFAAIETLRTCKDFRALETEFHKLKGSGRTYGIPEISLVGELIEKVCRISSSLREQAIPTSLQILQRIRKARASGQEYDLKQDQDFRTIEMGLSQSSS